MSHCQQIVSLIFVFACVLAFLCYNKPMSNKIVLLDSYSLLYRAYYAIQTPMSDKNGRPLNAVFGFTNMLLRIIDEIKPTHMVATFDSKGPTFRHEKCDYYKATRKPMPDDLRPQIDAVRQLLSAMDIKIVEKVGYEGDDLLGTLSKKLEGDKIIVTGDRDSLQLVSETTKVWLTKRGITDVLEYDLDRLAQEGLKPYQIIELKALMGDSSDNIKGIAGVGEKTAKSLIATYGDIENLYAHVDEIKGKLGEKLRDGKRDAEESKYLATINCDVEISSVINDFTFNAFSEKVKAQLEDFEFRSIIKRLDFEEGNSVDKKANNVEVKKVCNVSEINLEKGTLCAVIYDDYTLRVAVSKELEYLLNARVNLLDDGVYLDEALREIANSGAKVVLHDAKRFMHLTGVTKFDYFDTKIASYLLYAQRSYESVREVIDEYSEFDCGDNVASGLFNTYGILNERIEKEGLNKLLYEVEQPLTAVLYDMEKAGFCVDVAMLDELRSKYGEELKELETKIYQLAGEHFNINSPKQLQNVLYVKLGLPSTKKTKSGASTDAEALERLIGKHDIIEYILRYRQISKFKGTYIEGIDGLIDKKTGRVHTVFNQTATVTGRLSSTEPNLQNIPVRTEEGRELRKMFIASPNRVLVCADYSQIELRLLAAFSGDERLVRAYKAGEDIHKETASAVYGVDIDEVTSDMRRSAKAVNFGIIYGMSDYGLATELGIFPKHARYFIERYFDTYKSVKSYMDENKKIAKESGRATTMLGRIRAIPELSSSNYNVRGFGERAAMNMPLQGSAADIIKLSMIKVFDAIKEENLKARLILQVHDELIIDCPTEEVEKVKKLLKKNMEEAITLVVPLIADVGVGKNWYEAK